MSNNNNIGEPDKFELWSVVTKNSRSTQHNTQAESPPTDAYSSSREENYTTIPTYPKDSATTPPTSKH